MCIYDRYMEKLAVGPTVNPRAVSLNKPIASNIRAVAEAKGEDPLRGLCCHAVSSAAVTWFDALGVHLNVCREARWRRACMSSVYLFSNRTA